MVTALIFAGGTGQRMNTKSKPKQFLELYGKPIIIYTIEHFEYHQEIDNIVVVCLESWIEELQFMLNRYSIKKVKKILAGGNTGHDSIYLGLCGMEDFMEKDDIVLIHDGVRPLINEELISHNIAMVKKYGNAITTEAVRESIVQCEDGETIAKVPPRNEMYTAKAPQSFYYERILELYGQAQKDEIKTIDSAHLCSIYGEPMHMVKSTRNNIKITEPTDYYIYRALYEAMEGRQIFGL